VRGRVAAGAVALVVLLALVYWFALRVKAVEPRVEVPQLAATIGSGPEAIGVTGRGALVRWLPLPEDPPLPQLPLAGPPEKGRLRGPALEQVRVLAAVPDALRRYLASSSFGEDGVAITLTSGIELRFGGAADAERKWRAAAAVLADPEVTHPDYVDVQAPSRPAVREGETELPAAP
jgi:cell division septal protein FtsQ